MIQAGTEILSANPPFTFTERAKMWAEHDAAKYIQQTRSRICIFLVALFRRLFPFKIGFGDSCKTGWGGGPGFSHCNRRRATPTMTGDERKIKLCWVEIFQRGGSVE